MKRLFGTDGIRGKFGDWPLTEDVVYKIGLATGEWLKKKFGGKKEISVVVGKDTRASCRPIELNLAAGLMKKGITVRAAGIIPTPGLSWLTHNSDVKLGIMISASHNLACDNGIKFFKHNGFKPSTAEEKEIEKIIYSFLGREEKRPAKNKIKLQKVSSTEYLKYLKNCVDGLDLTGMKIVVDCANGAVSAYARKLFKSLGAKVLVLHDKPDGKNINLNCGSLHPQHVSFYAKKEHADAGFSFDGDGDRVIMVDEKGKILDGDYMLALLAKYFLKNKRLRGNAVVTTSMSNFGLEKFMQGLNLGLLRTDVGDRFVLEEMLRRKINIGGEQSGHIILLDFARTGDGLLTALQILKILKEENEGVSKLVRGFRKYPQLLVNVRVREKKDLTEITSVWKKIEQGNKLLENKGRLVVRYSGTEPLARIMAEGPDKKEITAIVDSISNQIKKEIGC